jgi:hypothetical protein
MEHAPMNEIEPSKELSHSPPAKLTMTKAERIIDELRAPPPAAPTPPLAVARRQLSNTLRLSQFCDNKTCRARAAAAASRCIACRLPCRCCRRTPSIIWCASSRRAAKRANRNWRAVCAPV